MAGPPEPAPGLLRRLDALARAAFPAGATILLMVAAAAPVGIPGLVPAAALPCVYFWTIFRPGAMPPPAVFAIGLMQDLLTLSPLGAGVLTLLIVHGLAQGWRRTLARQTFLLVWIAFCGVAAGAAALGWALQTVLGWQLPPFAPAVHLFALTAGLYPAVAFVLTLLHGAMQRAEDLP